MNLHFHSLDSMLYQLQTGSTTSGDKIRRFLHRAYTVARNGPFHLHWSIVDKHFGEVNDQIPDHVMSQYNR